MSTGHTTIRRTFRFEAAHRLPNVPAEHLCSRLHGHSYHVTVEVTGDVDPHMGWILDFADIDVAWKPLHAILDHYYLNEVPGLENPTAENIARFVYERLVLPAGRLHAITVHETCTSEVTYSER
jgi:6-pyruvoyltetrahydropterin/6-carboxytetrahydropterin synthase